MWDPQAEALAPHFRVLRFDTRGHGASAAVPGDYTIEQLGGDVLALVDALGIQQFAFCGLSLGGMVGQWLAVHAAGRLTHLVLANTTARVSDPSAMEARRRTVLESGMAAIADTVMARFFSSASLEQNAPAVASARRTLLSTSPVGYAGCCAAVRDWDQRADLGRIAAPTLIISGDHDVSMPWPDHGALLAASIPNSTVVSLEAAHISNLERPRGFLAALFGFLLARPADTLSSGSGGTPRGAWRRARRSLVAVEHGFHSGLSGAHHALRVGHGLDPAGARPPDPAPAGAGDHRFDGAMGGISPAPRRRPCPRARMARHRRGAPADGRLCGCAGGQHRLQDCRGNGCSEASALPIRCGQA